MSDIDDALYALMNYTQADEDGIMVVTSRQAIHVVADEIERLRADLKTYVEENAALAMKLPDQAALEVVVQAANCEAGHIRMVASNDYYATKIETAIKTLRGKS